MDIYDLKAQNDRTFGQGADRRWNRKKVMESDEKRHGGYQLPGNNPIVVVSAKHANLLIEMERERGD